MRTRLIPIAAFLLLAACSQRPAPEPLGVIGPQEPGPIVTACDPFASDAAGGVLRLIRLAWNCPGWDDGLTEATGNADRNFLAWYAKNPAVKCRVAGNGEQRTIMQLGNFTAGHAPPFVYLTGEGKGQITAEETQVLKGYLADGGMLIVDAGSATFHRWFTTWIRNLTGNRPLVFVAPDDVVFCRPYALDGIDPLFRHGGEGTRAMGCRIDGRWAVFYHPGDMNDCWKDQAHGIPERLRENSRHLMYNLIHDALVHYREAQRRRTTL